jgi:hypothetical protein
MVLVSSGIVDEARDTKWKNSFVKVDNFDDETFQLTNINTH